jgi:hypothetical protein
MADDPQPLACSLQGAAFKERIAWLKDLQKRALLDHRRDGHSLQLLFAKTAKSDVQALVEKENACCGFLSFAINETGRGLHLTITPPPDAVDFIDELLLHFEPEPR